MGKLAVETLRGTCKRMITKRSPDFGQEVSALPDKILATLMPQVYGSTTV